MMLGTLFAHAMGPTGRHLDAPRPEVYDVGDAYPTIEGHGLIEDLQTCSLVATDLSLITTAIDLHNALNRGAGAMADSIASGS
jgi:hypothetical protein